MQGTSAGGGGGWNRASIASNSSWAEPTSTVEISINCDKLINKDLVSKSDPFCVMLQVCIWHLTVSYRGKHQNIQNS